MIEGPNGLLPNLDLVNVLTKMAQSREIKVNLGPGNLIPFKSSGLLQMINRQAFGMPRSVASECLKYLKFFV